MAHQRNFDLDNPETTIKRRDFIASKPFMRQIYLEWYRILEKHLPDRRDVLIELGSGPGFIQDMIPTVISTDLLYLPFVNLVLNGLDQPFEAGSVDAIVMMNVFHHIPDIQGFLGEAERTLRVGGRLILIEP